MSEHPMMIARGRRFTFFANQLIFFNNFLFRCCFCPKTLLVRKKSTKNALKTYVFGCVSLFSFARWNLHNKNLHSKSMTYSSVIGSRRSNPYSVLVSKFCPFASVRRGGKMCCDVALWVELVVDFYAVAFWLSAKGHRSYLIFSKTGKFNISRTFT